jgi:hypothetical protein
MATHRKAIMLGISLCVILGIGFTIAITSPIQLTHALNPQPLPRQVHTLSHLKNF